MQFTSTFYVLRSIYNSDTDRQANVGVIAKGSVCHQSNTELKKKFKCVLDSHTNGYEYYEYSMSAEAVISSLVLV